MQIDKGVFIFHLVSTAMSAGIPSPSSMGTPETFDAHQLRAYMRKLMEATLTNVSFEKEQVKHVSQELSARIKDRMVELGPRYWKYIVTIIINENLGQGGRADMANHWGPKDQCIQEIYSNSSIVCVCFAYVIRLHPPTTGNEAQPPTGLSEPTQGR
ncbi:hypothetical protein NCC49_004008 [Naganishia albida]|nr:hypothetical protein NCC49_004008 [Naganishia albida]